MDAIKAFAAEQYGWGDEAPAVQEQEAQKARVVTSQDSLDAVAQASVPVEPADVNDQISQAMQDGDWQTSSALKAEKFHRGKYGSVGVGNLAATWMPNFAINIALKKKQ